MKRNLLVLVLLVTWSLLSIPSLSFAGTESDIAENTGTSEGASSPDTALQVNGVTDDDTGGDPGDAGDGYGVVDDGPIDPGYHGGYDGMDESIWDEFMTILQALIQLAL